MDMKLHESRAVVTGSQREPGRRRVEGAARPAGAGCWALPSGHQSLPGLQQAAGALVERAFAAAADLTTEAGQALSPPPSKSTWAV